MRKKAKRVFYAILLVISIFVVNYFVDSLHYVMTVISYPKAKAFVYSKEVDDTSKFYDSSFLVYDIGLNRTTVDNIKIKKEYSEVFVDIYYNPEDQYDVYTDYEVKLNIIVIYASLVWFFILSLIFTDLKRVLSPRNIMNQVMKYLDD